MTKDDKERERRDRALFEALDRLRVPLSGTDPMSPLWIVMTLVVGLLFIYAFAANR